MYVNLVNKVFNEPLKFLGLKLLSENKIRENKLTILETRTGVKLAVRHNIFDTLIIEEQFLQKQYIPPLLFTDNFRPKYILDIGSYIGDFSIYCASEFGSVIHCYEPTPQNYKILLVNCALNPQFSDQLYIFHQGVSAKRESIYMNVQDIEGEIHASSHKYESAPNTETILIDCVSLEDAIENMGVGIIDILKVDAEGQEFDIFGNCNMEFLRKHVRYIIFEHHSWVEDYQSKLKYLRSKLEASGYTFALRQGKVDFFTNHEL